jgi:hypothetical protein
VTEPIARKCNAADRHNCLRFHDRLGGGEHNRLIIVRDHPIKRNRVDRECRTNARSGQIRCEKGPRHDVDGNAATSIEGIIKSGRCITGARRRPPNCGGFCGTLKLTLLSVICPVPFPLKVSVPTIVAVEEPTKEPGAGVKLGLNCMFEVRHLIVPVTA